MNLLQDCFGDKVRVTCSGCATKTFDHHKWFEQKRLPSLHLHASSASEADQAPFGAPCL